MVVVFYLAPRNISTISPIALATSSHIAIATSSPMRGFPIIGAPGAGFPVICGPVGAGFPVIIPMITTMTFVLVFLQHILHTSLGTIVRGFFLFVIGSIPPVVIMNVCIYFFFEFGVRFAATSTSVFVLPNLHSFAFSIIKALSIGVIAHTRALLIAIVIVITLS